MSAKTLKRDEQEWIRALDVIATRIKQFYATKNRFMEILSRVKRKNIFSLVPTLAKKYSVENTLSITLKRTPLKGLKICGVDGGSLQQNLSSMAIGLFRAVGVIFSYHSSGIIAKYYPSKHPSPKMVFDTSPRKIKNNILKTSLLRELAEIQVALETLEEDSPDLIFFDGSIIPRPPEQKILDEESLQI